MTPTSSADGVLRLSWTRIRTHSECPAKGSLMRGHKSPISDARNYFPGTVTDRCMRQWLSLETQERGWMAAQVARIMDEEEKTAKATGDGVVRWKHASDKAEVREMCTRAVSRLEDDLWQLLWLDNSPDAQCDWDPAPRFEVPCTIPHPRGGKEKIYLIGEIDLLVRRPNGSEPKAIEVWDLKTTRDNSYWRKTLGQLVFYEIAVWCMTKKQWPDVSGLLQPLCDETMPSWCFDMRHRTQMLQRIVSTANDIWAGRLDPRPEKSKCGYCEVRHACPLKSKGRGRVAIGSPVTGA